MFSYYGAKTNIIKKYPAPIHGKIIEPFAGSARYALQYWDREILIVDRYQVVVNVWKWLQGCSRYDILSLPRELPAGYHVDEMKFDCAEARDFFGFIIGKGDASPKRSVTDWVGVHRPNYINFGLERVANNLHKIKHWDIRYGSYEDVENEKCTWFIDPPYFGQPGESYPFGSHKLNFRDLANFCLSRSGQVIVCEGPGATWLPFREFVTNAGRLGRKQEMIYYQEDSAPTPFLTEQLRLF